MDAKNLNLQSLGCNAEVEEKVTGARGEHKIDVWVRFKKFGFQIKWVIECKYWNSAVTKEKVLALRSVVEDVGADRGIMISTAGFQSGAIRVSENTNITLTDLDELKKTAQEDLLTSGLHRIETKAVELMHAFKNLYNTEQTSAHSWKSTLRPGADSKAVIRTIGNLSMLEYGFDRVRLKMPPYPIKFDKKGESKIVVDTVNEFVDQASKLISEAESTLNLQRGAQ